MFVFCLKCVMLQWGGLPCRSPKELSWCTYRPNKSELYCVGQFILNATAHLYHLSMPKPKSIYSALRSKRCFGRHRCPIVSLSSLTGDGLNVQRAVCQRSACQPTIYPRHIEHTPYAHTRIFTRAHIRYSIQLLVHTCVRAHTHTLSTRARPKPHSQI